MNRDTIEWYKNYLEKYFSTFKTLTKSDLEEFRKLDIDASKSYYAFSKSEIRLNKFICYYLILRYSRFVEYTFYEYASDLCDDEAEIIEPELLILFSHQHGIDIGKTENWLYKTILNKVANRHRRNLRNIIITKRHYPELQNSGEFETIDLDSSVISVKGLFTTGDSRSWERE